MSRIYSWLLKVLARQISPTRRTSNTVQSQRWLRWGMRALGTAQHHLTSIPDKFRTTSRSNQDDLGSHAVTSLFPGYSAIVYIARFTNALSLYQLNPQLYISGSTVPVDAGLAPVEA